MNTLQEVLEILISDKLYQVILSNPRDKGKINKIKIRPVLVKGKLFFPETAYIGTRVFHENYDREMQIERIINYLSQDFGQGELESTEWTAMVLVSKKGKMTIKKKKKANSQETGQPDLSHNRVKKYILEEGTKVPFLVDLGVQTQEGKIVRAKYDKFKQINRFLEFVEDILPALPKGKEVHIIDFGCGKSYLTFAMYYYLQVLQKIPVRITGLDLKEDVINHCNQLSIKYGYEKLQFIKGDISSFNGASEVDMVVTLHACDTATDFALHKAVLWNAKVILSVPCCQHEVNKQIQCKELEPVLKYGLIKERMSALLTDAIRANLLEEQGYATQILEFIDMEHTPKNILIRAVKREKTEKKAETHIEEVSNFLQIQTTLQKLLAEQEEQ